jgi:hypothetical protein
MPNKAAIYMNRNRSTLKLEISLNDKTVFLMMSYRAAQLRTSLITRRSLIAFKVEKMSAIESA